MFNLQAVAIQALPSPVHTSSHSGTPTPQSYHLAQGIPSNATIRQKMYSFWVRRMCSLQHDVVLTCSPLNVGDSRCISGKVSILSPFLPSCEVLLKLFKNKCGISWYVSPDLSRSQPFQALTPDRKKKRRVASKNYEGFVWREWFLFDRFGHPLSV
jgi:hypothetical protein